MKRAVLNRKFKIIREQDRILIELFEENLSKRLDEIFKIESKSLVTNLNKNIKKPICNMYIYHTEQSEKQ